MIFPELRPNSLFDTDAQVRPRQRHCSLYAGQPQRQNPVSDAERV